MHFLGNHYPQDRNWWTLNCVSICSWVHFWEDRVNSARGSSHFVHWVSNGYILCWAWQSWLHLPQNAALDIYSWHIFGELWFWKLGQLVSGDQHRLLCWIRDPIISGTQFLNFTLARDATTDPISTCWVGLNVISPNHFQIIGWNLKVQSCTWVWRRVVGRPFSTILAYAYK